MKILILVGPPCSGKSTFANEFINNNASWVRFNRDDIRSMLNKTTGLNKNFEQLVVEMQNIGIEAALESGYNIVIDNTHCNKHYLDYYTDNFQKHKIFIKTFDIPLLELLKRNEQRFLEINKIIPTKAIAKLHTNFKELLKSYNFEKYEFNESIV